MLYLLVLMMLINALFRAHGDAAVAAIVMVGSAVVNIGLDPVLIYGWGPIPALGGNGQGCCRPDGSARC